MEHSFEPIIDRRSRLLILGSLPGAVSLKKNEYYANRLNRFWEILFSVMGRPISTDYLSKVMFLRDNQIALWDVIKSAERTGSSDSNIKTAIANDIPKLLQDNPGISFLIFNGRFSFNSYRKFSAIRSCRLKSCSQQAPHVRGETRKSLRCGRRQ